MKQSIADLLVDIASSMDSEVVRKHRPSPKFKPPRRKPSVSNKSQRSDYSKEYMRVYRKEQGKDYQRIPESIKKQRTEHRKRLKEKFDLN